jgi:hypothetical protein
MFFIIEFLSVFSGSTECSLQVYALFILLYLRAPQTIHGGCALDISSNNMFGVWQSTVEPNPGTKIRK